LATICSTAGAEFWFGLVWSCLYRSVEHVEQFRWRSTLHTHNYRTADIQIKIWVPILSQCTITAST
jgi:hypothetical protein